MATKKSKKTAKKKTVKKAVAKKASAKNKTAKKSTAKKKSVKKTAKKTVKKAVPKKTSTKKTVKKKTIARKPAVPAKKTAPKKKKRGTSPRDKKVLVIRDRLLDQRNQLLSEAESALGQLPGQILFPDMGDQASAEIDRNFMLRLRGREQKLLKKIDGVLETIDNGSYGICESCGAEIEIKRLEARPVTTLCIECKTEQEEEERLRE